MCGYEEDLECIMKLRVEDEISVMNNDSDIHYAGYNKSNEVSPAER